MKSLLSACAGEMSYEYRYDPYASVERQLHWTDGTVLTMVSGVP